MSFKKVKVVMLPTNEKSKLVLSYCNELAINWTHDLAKFDDATYQNLYFLSDEEIKVGDWCIMLDSFGNVFSNPQQYTNPETQHLNKGLKKIIATTDKSLGLVVDNNDCPMPAYSKFLPQSSQSFIEKFVEEYNKGNRITEVMVEYDRLTSFWEREKDGLIVFTEKEMGEVGGVFTFYEGNKLKINPKDNTITIRKVKESWNREEVLQLLRIAFFRNGGTKTDFDKFIEENF